MTHPITVQSPAKLNLFLHIVGRRPDGYHLLQTIFQLIDFHDTITFSLREDKQIVLTDNTPNIPPESNLILKAARALHQSGLPGVNIHLHKRIPTGAGLGGGSSNAATTLLTLNRLWALERSQDALMTTALSLGADVPVFVLNHTAFAEGVGEILTPIDLPDTWYAIVKPPIHANTADLYRDPLLTRNTKPITIADYFAGADTHNDFLPVLLKHFPALHSVIDSLKPFGEPKLTGSGSAFFVACDSREKAEKCIGQIDSQMVGFVAQGLNSFWGVAKR